MIMPYPNPYFMNPNAYQQMQQMAMQQYQNMQMPQQVTQSNVIIHVASEEVARKWDVAPNCSVMFINDNEPYFYTKSAGTSIIVAVPSLCGYESISVTNISTQAINVINANLIITYQGVRRIR